LPYSERFVLIDQGHKLVASINDIIAADGGAIAGQWSSRWRQPGYNYREEHKERDGQFFLIRDSWAHRAGLVKKGKAGYVDESTAPGQEPACRCSYKYVYNIRDLPDDMLTAKGKAWLANARIVSAARADDAASGLDLVHSEIFRKALRRDALGYFVGVTDVRFVDDRDAWHASYESDDDSVEIQRKFDQLPAMDRVQILLHEAGHRGQEIDPGTYAEFKRRHLNKIGSFLEMANRIHLDDLRRRGKVDSVASEVFAESYARFMLKLPLPAELAQFWEERMTIRPAVGIEAERRRLMRRLEAIG